MGDLVLYMSCRRKVYIGAFLFALSCPFELISYSLEFIKNPDSEYQNAQYVYLLSFQDDTVTHSNKKHKDEVSLSWMAPADYSGTAVFK